MTTIQIVLNTDKLTYRPFTSTDECTLRSFGGYDMSDPATWTREQYKAFGIANSIRFLAPIS